MKKIAIVGGGCSGAMVLAQLVDKVAPGTAIDIIEASGVFGPGLAYGTSDSGHLLNVPAGRMGAFEPDHFLCWLSSAEGAAEAAQLWPGRQPAAGDYLPRALYGRYLESVLAVALRRAAARDVQVSLIQGRVLDAAKRGKAPVIGLRALIGRKHSRRTYGALVLATGNHPPRAPKVATGWGRPSTAVANPWAALQDQAVIKKLQHLSAKDMVLLLGTGLTAVDAALSLERCGFPGRIIALAEERNACRGQGLA